MKTFFVDFSLCGSFKYSLDFVSLNKNPVFELCYFVLFLLSTNNKKTSGALCIVSFCLCFLMWKTRTILHKTNTVTMQCIVKV